MQTRSRFLVLGVCCVSLFIVSMDTTAVPSIGEDFGAPISGLQWTIDAYIVVLAGFLLLSFLIAALGLTVVGVGGVSAGGWAGRTTDRVAHLFGDHESPAARSGHLGDPRASQGGIEVDAAGNGRR